MGMQALALSRVPEVGQRLEENREGVVVWGNGGSGHVGVDGERDVGDVGVREGSDEGVAGEDMGGWELGEDVEVG